MLDSLFFYFTTHFSPDADLQAGFYTATAEIGVLEEHCPPKVSLESIRLVLARKVFHARSGATFRKASDVLIKLTQHLRETLKSSAAAKAAQQASRSAPPLEQVLVPGSSQP